MTGVHFLYPNPQNYFDNQFEKNSKSFQNPEPRTLKYNFDNTEKSGFFRQINIYIGPTHEKTDVVLIDQCSIIIAFLKMQC